jgi:hypothetical protein
VFAVEEGTIHFESGCSLPVGARSERAFGHWHVVSAVSQRRAGRPAPSGRSGHPGSTSISLGGGGRRICLTPLTLTNESPRLRQDGIATPACGGRGPVTSGDRVAGDEPRKEDPRRDRNIRGMIGLRRAEAWPGGRRRPRIRWRGWAGLRTPVLVVAAALFGAAVSGTVLVGFWDREAGGRHAAETRLAASEEHARALAHANIRLRRHLVDSRATAVRLEQGVARLRVAAQVLLRKNAALVASARRLHGQGGSLEGRAAAVSRLAATLGNDLVAVLGYITNTSAGALDPSYLKAQLDYLRPAVVSVRSAAEALGVDASSYGNAVAGFTVQAAAYATALRRLARERATVR